MRISDWSSDVCSSDLIAYVGCDADCMSGVFNFPNEAGDDRDARFLSQLLRFNLVAHRCNGVGRRANKDNPVRSEEHTSELQSLMRISYAVFCLKKKK